MFEHEIVVPVRYSHQIHLNACAIRRGRLEAEHLSRAKIAGMHQIVSHGFKCDIVVSARPSFSTTNMNLATLFLGREINESRLDVCAQLAAYMSR